MRWTLLRDSLLNMLLVYFSFSNVTIIYLSVILLIRSVSLLRYAQDAITYLSSAHCSGVKKNNLQRLSQGLPVGYMWCILWFIWPNWVHLWSGFSGTSLEGDIIYWHFCFCTSFTWTQTIYLLLSEEAPHNGEFLCILFLKICIWPVLTVTCFTIRWWSWIHHGMWQMFKALPPELMVWGISFNKLFYFK